MADYFNLVSVGDFYKIRHDFSFHVLNKFQDFFQRLFNVSCGCSDLDPILHDVYSGVKMIPQIPPQGIFVDHNLDLAVICSVWLNLRKQDAFGDSHLLVCFFLLPLLVVDLLLDENSQRLHCLHDVENLLGDEGLCLVKSCLSVGIHSNHNSLCVHRAAGALDLELVHNLLIKVLDNHVSKLLALKSINDGGTDVLKVDGVSKHLQVSSTPSSVDFAACDLDFVLLRLAILVFVLALKRNLGYLAGEL